MTDVEYRLKYPIGTKIKFLNPHIDTGLTGTVVGFTRQVDVYLPKADKHIVHSRYPVLSDGTKFTWHCEWNEIELIYVPNEQLVFSFME